MLTWECWHLCAFSRSLRSFGRSCKWQKMPKVYKRIQKSQTSSCRTSKRDYPCVTLKSRETHQNSILYFLQVADVSLSFTFWESATVAASFSRSFATALQGEQFLWNMWNSRSCKKLWRFSQKKKKAHFSVLSMALVGDAAVGGVVEASAAPGCKCRSSMHWRSLKP